MKSTQRQLKGSAYMYFCWLIEYKDIGFIGQFGAQSALNDAQINPNVLTFFTKMERGKGPTNRQVENYVFIHLIDYEPAVGIEVLLTGSRKVHAKKTTYGLNDFPFIWNTNKLDNVA